MKASQAITSRQQRYHCTFFQVIKLIQTNEKSSHF